MSFVKFVLGKEVKELLKTDFKEPSPSLKDIMNDDLTGASKQVKKKSRTEDDLRGGPPKVTKDEKAEALAEEILFYLVMECRSNMFPQRVNPTKLKLRTEEEIAKFEKQKLEKSQLESSMASEGQIKSPEELHDEFEDDLPQSRMAIKTGPNTIKEYMQNLFSKIHGKEEDFIANLSSPLQRNPLEILMHLQNTQYELESYEQLPYQQSVLTVDIYLDIERSRKKTEEQQLTIERQKAREEHEKQKELKEQEKSKAEPSNPDGSKVSVCLIYDYRLTRQRFQSKTPMAGAVRVTTCQSSLRTKNLTLNFST